MGCLEVEFLGQWTDMDIIFQAKALETTQPGDRCELVRTLIVVPDVGAINFPRSQAESSNQC